jgi:hypothetical protein
MRNVLITVPSLWLVTLWSLDSSAQDQESPPTPKSAIALYHAGSAAISSFDVYFTVESRHLLIDVEPTSPLEGVAQGARKRRKLKTDEKPTVERRFYHQLYHARKERLEILDGPRGKAVEVIACDGQLERVLTVAQRNGQLRYPDLVNEEGMQYRDLYQTLYGGVRISTVLQERPNWICQLVKTKPDSVPDLMLASAALPQARINSANCGIELVLAADRGMLPRRVSRLEMANGPLENRRTDVLQWHKLGDNSWVPVRAVTTFRDREKGDTFAQKLKENELVVDVAASRWNVVFEEDAFQLPFPQGTRVYDLIRRVQYTVGAPDTGKNIDQLLENAKGVTQLPLATAPPPAPTTEWWRNVVALIVTLVVLFLLVFLVLVQLRRRRLVRPS